jgi:lipopolysaccharide/colanic/teichoic acid biosynthesis glycosyltransferase
MGPAFMAKRLFDIVIAAGALLILSPLLALIAIMIKREDGGPVFYRGVRVGRFGRPFRMLKFRTMIVDAEKAGGSSTAANDPRITRCGHWLRSFKLDELPQFVNVLRGEMSLVGPRPQVAWAVELYSAAQRDALLSVRPGITDYASVKFSNEAEILRDSADQDRAYLELIAPEKIRLGMLYVQQHGLLTDLRILGLTIRNLIGWGTVTVPEHPEAKRA